jgi:hypothetical protein
MLRSSFRSIATRVYPRPTPRKRSFLGILVLAVLLAGCGGGGNGSGGGGTTTEEAGGRRVDGPGFTFSAPESWQVSRQPRTATIRPGGDEPTLASVTALTLRSKYTPALYAKVSKELDSVATMLADKLNGKVIARRDVVVSGIRSRQYDLAYEKGGSGLVDRITFVLRGKDEYYVLCRWLADQGEPDACGLLLRTFAPR